MTGIIASTPTLYRSMPVADIDLAGDGRTLEVLMVPWDTPAHILEIVDGEPLDYHEGFRRGAFDRQILAGSDEPGHFGRITFKDEHEGGYGKLGRVRHMENVNAGLYGRIRVDTDNVQKVRDAKDDGITDLSIEFHPIVRARPDADGVVWRTDAWLTAVALEPMGAYEGAEVLAMRAQSAETEIVEAGRRQLDDVAAWMADQAGKWDHL